ncbi:hypothetical protein [Streptomyces alboflavus]|uniref:hypothetical protein n=1 Tax=Streptomyces alboflavus TaxID=67267 RepID=UPI0012FE8729|nr:hypothetical protein [Streptomyces alboflavus]
MRWLRLGVDGATVAEGGVGLFDCAYVWRDGHRNRNEFRRVWYCRRLVGRPGPSGYVRKLLRTVVTLI